MRRCTSLGTTGLVLVIALMMGWPTTLAWARSRRVAVISISGPGAKRVRRFLEQAIDERFNLVTYSDVQEAAEDLGIHRRYARRGNLKRICRKAGIDAAVTGYVFRRRRRWWWTWPESPRLTPRCWSWRASWGCRWWPSGRSRRT